MIREYILNDIRPLKCVKACFMSSIWSILIHALWSLERIYFLNLLGTQCSAYIINYVKLINCVSQIFYMLSDVFFSACYISY